VLASIAPRAPAAAKASGRLEAAADWASQRGRSLLVLVPAAPQIHPKAVHSKSATVAPVTKWIAISFSNSVEGRTECFLLMSEARP
jgi:hypothetical protein